MNADGPHVSIAALCESILDEKNGRMSCIRFLDKLDVNYAVSGDASQLPSPIPIPPFKVNGLIGFKSGSFKGKKSIRIKVIKPSGVEMQIKGDIGEALPVVFEGGEHGVNIVLDLTLQVDEEGLYYFDVLVDQEMVTRIPLKVTFTKHIQTDVPQPENSTTADTSAPAA